MDISNLTPEEQDELLQLLEVTQHEKAKSHEEQMLEEERKALTTDFTAFAKAAWPILEPGNPLSWSWHYDLIAEHLMLCATKKLHRLIINIPPRTLKSLLVTVMFPAWVWARDPSNSFVCASYAQGLSEEHSVKRRRLLESAWFQRLWGHRVWLQKDQNQKSKFQNNFQAQMYATSVGGTLTGMGGNYLISDDAIKPDEVASEPVLASLHSWFTNTWRSRLNNPSEDVMIIVEQRTGELDLTGFCLEADKVLTDQGKAPEWTVLCVPLEADEEAIDPRTGVQTFTYPISGKVKRRALGDVLQPDRFTPAVVAAWKVRRVIWATQYQGRPMPLEGNLIKRSEVRYYGGKDPLTGIDDPDMPLRFDTVLTSTDCSFKDTKTADYVCVGTVGVKGPDRFVLDVVTKHLDAPATEKEINRQRLRWRARVNLIEDKANGPAVISSMRKKVPGVVAVDPQGGKISRMYGIMGEWQAGNWYVDRNAAWCEPFVESITKFPGARHDDDVDMMTQAATYLQNHGFANGFAAWIREQEGIAMGKGNRNHQNQSFRPQSDMAASSTVEKIQQFGEASVAKPVVSEDTEACTAVVNDEVCGSTLLQRIPGGIRCGQCGAQYMSAVVNKPHPNLVRKAVAVM